MSQSSDQATSSTPARPMVKETNKEGRKQLPSIPDTQTQAAMAARPKQHGSIVKANTNSYGPFMLEYSLMAEYNLLMQQKTPGCYVIPSAMSSLVWYGVLFIRQGLYQEGAFKFTVIIPDNFPNGDCPSLVFDLPVFHPLVDPLTGQLDVKRAFQKWRKNVNHVWQVLLYARRVFYKIDSKSPLNKEAAELYETDLESFKKNVAESVEKSKERLNDPVKSDDPHCLRFSPWDPSIHEESRQQMLKTKENESDNGPRNGAPQPGVSSKGLSWMKPGSVQIFARDDPALA
ncbi:AKT-interacting protein-like isoform X2 [Mizuhopecten yessoensis]|uniref:AKT-interacting protein-like isoform X2 n=1 Tax=Mizuhopecten yessoensis TaxID=6573 RepID=UPI000B45C65A|nr:AKT-interacting protein-like isoform X2 [Mizuhopecten yessoensis]